MQSSWKIGSLFGIPLYIDPSWFLILAFITIVNVGDVNASQYYQASKPVLAWLVGLAMALLLFGSVLLHELGHSLVARSQGIPVNSITLFLFGGVAAIDRESKTPGQAFQVAIAGPVVSILLFGVFYLVTQTLPDTNLLKFLTSDLARINLILALFNLTPGLPLDGGQVVKAAVWKLTGNRFKGVRWAATTGNILGWSAIGLGLVTVLFTGEFTAIWMVLIGSFVVRNANNYNSVTNLQEALVQLTAADAMSRDFRVIDADMRLRQFADEYILSDAWMSQETKQVYPYYAASDGRYRGLVRVEDLNFIERSRWETETVHAIVRPLTEIVTVEEKTPLVEAIDSMEVKQLKRLTVLSPAGAIAGVIDRGDIVRALTSKLNLSFSDADIKRIKAEGSYPASLQLQAIAKASIE